MKNQSFGIRLSLVYPSLRKTGFCIKALRLGQIGFDQLHLMSVASEQLRTRPGNEWIAFNSTIALLSWSNKTKLLTGQEKKELGEIAQWIGTLALQAWELTLEAPALLQRSDMATHTPATLVLWQVHKRLVNLAGHHPRFSERLSQGSEAVVEHGSPLDLCTHTDR